MMYIYQQKNWPHFNWDQSHIYQMLIQLRYQQGLLIGGMESIGFDFQEKAVLHNLTEDVVKSSEIEGEFLDQSLVRSSVARHLGIEIGGLDIVDRNIEGIVEMVLDATQRFDQPLNKERLLSWHKSLFPTGQSGLTKISVGKWRKGPIQVVSGYMGKGQVHFEGPPADQVDREMMIFLNWFNDDNGMNLVLKAALAHLWFLTIHPFDDGNGRIGRAIADLLLARSEKSSRRFYSLSTYIQKERKDYYTFLEKAQKGTLDVTQWIEWFFGCLGRAIQSAIEILEEVKYKVRFWDSFSAVPLNDRQRKMINLLLEDFKGNLTTSKWAKLVKCSQDTAYRDIMDLTSKGILIKSSQGGRSTSYVLATLNLLC